MNQSLRSNWKMFFSVFLRLGASSSQDRLCMQEKHSGLHTRSLLNCPRNGDSMTSKTKNLMEHRMFIYVLQDTLINQMYNDISMCLECIKRSVEVVSCGWRNRWWLVHVTLCATANQVQRCKVKSKRHTENKHTDTAESEEAMVSGAF